MPTLGPPAWKDSFDAAALSSAYTITNSVGTVVDTNSGAGSLRIQTTGTAIQGYLDWGRAVFYLPGLLDFDLTCDVILNGSVEQYPDFSFRADNGTATGAPDVAGNGYDYEFGGATTGSWINEVNASTLTSNAANETATAQPGNGTTNKVHIVAYGDTIRTKRWTAGTSGEPDLWQLTYVDRKHYLASGRPYFIIGLLGGSTNGCNGRFDNLVISRLYLGRAWSHERRLLVPTSGALNANLGTATVGITANPMSFTDGIAVPNATLVTTANPLTFGGQTLPSASVAIAANLLSRSGAAFSTATLALTANAISLAAQLGTASLALSANPISYADAIGVIAASLGISANTLSFADLVSAGTATLGVSAKSLSDNLAQPAASLGVAATGLTGNTRNLGTATLSTSATGLGTAGYQLTAATLSVIANNLGLVGSFNLGTASVNFTANNLGNQVVTQANLGAAALSVNAQSLSVALSPGLAASVAMTALGLARAAGVATASVSVSAADLSSVRQATLGLATLVTQANNLSQSAPGTAALGNASVVFSANPVSSLVLLSAGLGSLAMVASPIAPLDSGTGRAGSVATTAQGMSSTRAIASGVLDLTAYGLGSYRPSAMGTAALALTAYALSIDVGVTKGIITVGRPYLSIKSGGRVLPGISSGRPYASLIKTDGA